MTHLRVPHYEQHTDYTCGPTCLEMVLAFFRERKDEMRLAREAATTSQTGTTHEHMARAAHEEGFHTEENHDATIHHIKEVLKKGLPIIVNYIEPPEEVGHYGVVVGIEGGQILLNDPANGRTQKFHESEFLRRWHSSHSRRWMMVISKQLSY